MILSTLTVAMVAGAIIIRPGSARISKADSTSPNVEKYWDWENDSSKYPDNWTYSNYDLVWGTNDTVIGSNGTANQTYFYVETDVNESSNVNETWNDMYTYIYLDYSNTTDMTNITDPTSTNFTGGQSYYEVWCWMSYYSVTTNLTENFTIWQVDTDSYGDYQTDINGDYIMHQVPIWDFHPDPAWYDWFFDSFPGNNVTFSPTTYTEFYYGYEIYQYTGKWSIAGNSSSEVDSSLDTLFQGYSVYKDRNNNGVFDLNLTEDPTDPEDMVISNDTEWLYNMDFLNYTTFDVSTPITSGNSVYFDFTFSGIVAALLNYTDTLGEAYDDNGIQLAYIPTATTTFNLTWSGNETSLKVGHALSKIYDYDQAKYYHFYVDPLPAMQALDGTSLMINYLGDIWSEQSFEYTRAEAGSSEYLENDTFSVGTSNGTNLLQISTKGKYLWNGSVSVDITASELPYATYSALSSYYEHSDSDVATGSVNTMETVFLLCVCVNDWNGGSFSMDPVFSTLINNATGSQGPTSSSQWYLILIIIAAIIAIIAIVVVIKKKSGKRE